MIWIRTGWDIAWSVLKQLLLSTLIRSHDSGQCALKPAASCDWAAERHYYRLVRLLYKLTWCSGNSCCFWYLFHWCRVQLPLWPDSNRRSFTGFSEVPARFRKTGKRAPMWWPLQPVQRLSQQSGCNTELSVTLSVFIQITWNYLRFEAICRGCPPTHSQSHVTWNPHQHSHFSMFCSTLSLINSPVLNGWLCAVHRWKGILNTFPTAVRSW